MISLPAHIRLTGEVLPVAEAAPGGRSWRVVVIREGFSKNRGPKGLPIFYDSAGFAEAAEKLEGAPVHAKGLGLGVLHEDRDPASAAHPAEQVRKTPNGTRVGYLRSVAVEAVDGVKAIVARLEIVPRAQHVHDWLRERLDAGKRLMDLSVNSITLSRAEAVDGTPAHRVVKFEKFASVDLVGQGAAGGTVLAMAAGVDDLADAIYAVLTRCAAAYVAGVDRAALDEADLIDRLRQAVDENIGTTLDAAGVADHTAQRVREVYELRGAYQALRDGRREEAWRCMASVMGDAFAPGSYGSSYAYGAAEAAPLAVAASADPEAPPQTEPPAEGEPGGIPAEPQDPPVTAEEDVMAATATTVEATEQLSEIREARAEASKALASTMIEKTRLNEPLKLALCESIDAEIDEGKTLKRADIQARIDKQLALQEKLTGAGQVRVTSTVSRFGAAEARGGATVVTAYERIRDSYRRGLGCTPEMFGLAKWADGGHSRLGLAEAFKLLTGDHEFTGRYNEDALDESVAGVVLHGRERFSRLDKVALAEAMSETGNFTELTADALNKKLQAKYKALEIPEREFVEEVSVDNLHSAKLIQVGGFAPPSSRAEGDDYAEATAPADTQATATAVDYGFYKAISYEMLRKDATPEIAMWPDKMAISQMHGYRRAICDAILNYASAVNDGTIYDSTALYTVAHVNGATTALSASSFDVGYIAMCNQTEQQSSRPGVVEPGYLWTSVNNRVLALQICGPDTNNEMPGTANRNSNPNQGIVKVITAPLAFVRSDTTFWAIIANPAMGGSGFVATFLDGKKEPEILVASGPTDGLTLGSARQTKFVTSWYRSPVVVADYRAFYAGGLASIA